MRSARARPRRSDYDGVALRIPSADIVGGRPLIGSRSFAWLLCWELPAETAQLIQYRARVAALYVAARVGMSHLYKRVGAKLVGLLREPNERAAEFRNASSSAQTLFAGRLWRDRDRFGHARLAVSRSVVVAAAVVMARGVKDAGVAGAPIGGGIRDARTHLRWCEHSWQAGSAGGPGSDQLHPRLRRHRPFGVRLGGLLRRRAAESWCALLPWLVTVGDERMIAISSISRRWFRAGPFFENAAVRRGFVSFGIGMGCGQPVTTHGV